MQIEQKFNEFDELVATGRNLLDKDHHLTQMVSRVTHLPLTAILECIVGFIFFLLLQTPELCLAGKRAHGGTEEYAWVDLGALEGSETTVAS